MRESWTGRVLATAIVAGMTMALAPAVAGAQEPDPAAAGALVTPFRVVEGREVDDRLPQPEDRHALAGGCYTIEAPGEGFVTATGSTVTLNPDEDAAAPLHFQATRLGEYLLATNEGRSAEVEGSWWDDRGYLGAAPVLPEGATGLVDLLPTDVLLEGLPDVDGPVGDTVAVAASPAPAGEWRIRAAGDAAERADEAGQDYVLDLPAVGKALAAVDGSLVLVDQEAGGTGFRFHHVPDDDPADDDSNGAACATWPEISTNTSGPPAPTGRGAAAPVEGFFEAHVHGMAFEFLGGKVRCGRPWHPYGVEHALPDCREDGEVGNPVLEVALADADPSGYDPVGWPTFNTWPTHELLTHEQWYWKWLERAYHGGLRLTTNLLVDNTALCQLYPQKKNSCNEMDSVRLQARRIFELQDYVDAQSGGPGEGWFRIVTTPAEARRAINSGRMAVVLGIEVSVLLDCGEILGQPQCTRDDVDHRLQEVFDMGVRQMELINKFDNGFSGVTGDGGSTGLVVNQGNKWVTGHYWDMRTCPEEADDGHVHDHGTIHGEQYDKTQMNPSDDAGLGEAGEVDVLAGAILQEFGDVTSTAAPVYPPAPHCNAVGLTDLGAYLVEQMVRKGVIVDPDHMSAAGQRGLLDVVADQVIPAERAAAAEQQRPAVQPGLISSHSWANDVTYQRILALAGMVAPRTGTAAVFADRWATTRRWAQDLAPGHVTFGLGYGADTNGFGAQPGPRSDPATPFTYADGGWSAPIGGVQVFQQTSGTRTFDLAAEGVAHYGMFADWFREVALAADEQYPELGGGAAVMRDMLQASESYLQMWERAVYGGNDCVTDQATFQVEDLHALIGGNLEGFLEAVGQPVSRDGSVYTYCAEGEGGQITPVDVEFDDDGDATDVRPSPGTVTPDDPAPAADAHRHPTPATGGGLAGIALALLGATAMASRRFARR